MEKNNSRFILTFEWHSLLRDILRNFWLIVLAGMIAYMGVYISERSVYSPTYSSSATMVVRAKTGTSGAYTNLTVSADMANIFTTVFTDSAMKKMAAANLGMETFDATVSASAIEGINLMNLSVKADDPELAFNLLRSILEIYPTISESIFSDAVIDVLVAPQVPTSPSNTITNTHRNIFILCAMALMGGIIVLLSLLRDTVKHEKAFEKFIDSKLISTITHERKHVSFKEFLTRKKRALLVDNAFSTLRFTEDYRKTATKLEYMQKHHNCRSFAITSVAENEGKSTAAANIALVLASRGFKVMLFDMDFRKPSIYKIFDCDFAVETELSDILSKKKNSDGYKVLRYKKSSLFIALNKRPCSNSASWLGDNYVKEYIDGMKNKMDFVIIDTPPVSVSADAANIIGVCDKTVMVVRTDSVEVADINDAILNIENIGGNVAGCILNDVYRPFTLFGQMGADDGGLYSYRYGSYKRYNNYGSALSEYMFETTDTDEITNRGDL